MKSEVERVMVGVLKSAKLFLHLKGNDLNWPVINLRVEFMRSCQMSRDHDRHSALQLELLPINKYSFSCFIVELGTVKLIAK